MKKMILKAVIGIAVIVICGSAVIAYQNSFDIKIVPVEIPTSKGILKGELVFPDKEEKIRGLVVFIHGDGPADASYNDAYKPLWEELAYQGYASLSWNKPGVGGSAGNWLAQSMDDRAFEALEVINWARSLTELKNKKIGLWGSSQAGWVIPKIIRQDKNIAFCILVAPAVNWLEQGLYNTLAQMQRDGKSLKEQEQAKKEFLWGVSMLDKNISYQDYHNSPKADKSITEDRWNFILKNYKSDSTEDIRHFYSPVKLFLGGRDINVDSVNTKQVYEKEVRKDLLSVTLIPSTDHFMLRESLVDSKLLTFLTALFAPRQLADKEYYEGVRVFLQSVGNTH